MTHRASSTVMMMMMMMKMMVMVMMMMFSWCRVQVGRNCSTNTGQHC